MMLLASDHDLATRRSVAAGPLAGLTASLAADLEPLVSRDLYFPVRKALLSREGGRCSRDGTLLEFDPFSPGEHRCPMCGEMYRGELHDRFWVYWYQMWLAERAVHASALSVLGRRDFAPLAAAILDGYVTRYESYPNVDNVLGPTRLFFSTYLESIWLLQICMATDLLDASEPQLTARVRDRIIVPSRSIVSVYDEGASNRQVWNNAALLASALLLGDQRASEQAVHGPSGIAAHVSHGLLSDGTWYEGENYHQFAHRGLWYGVTMAERAGIGLSEALTERFQLGFAAPFFTALPDFTLPSRRDSQYAVSLRQWRMAEHCELGLARREDPVLLGALERMYCDDVPRRETGRRTSAADVERNMPPTALSRSDLSWRALLCARPTLPALDGPPPQSELLEGQGIAIFRRDSGRAYVALDYGHSGGGHGHPDRLNVLLAHGETRWLDDFGTGSYVDPTLHWYRSTLAHNAPLFDGKSQRRRDGTLVAFDERGAAGWAVAQANDLAPGVSAQRTIVVMPGYSIDVVAWEADHEVEMDLPIHVDLSTVSGAGAVEVRQLIGGAGLEDGFEFAHDATVQVVGRQSIVHARARGDGGGQLDLWAASTNDSEWWRAIAPGPPGRGDRPFHVVRASANAGTHRLVWSWSGDVASVEFGETIRVLLSDGTIHEHQHTVDGWHIDLLAAGAHSSIDLAGSIDPTSDVFVHEVAEGPTLTIGGAHRRTILELGEEHYRRSEQSWHEAGRPTATVTLTWTGEALLIAVDVLSSDLNFSPATATNPYDNEHPDINGDGIQLYVRTVRDHAWMLVPESGTDAVRVRALDASTGAQPLVARWQPVGQGYRVTLELPSSQPPLALDVIINEMPRGRERRRGQLVLSGALGEFVYLRGDRHDSERLIRLLVSDA